MKAKQQTDHSLSLHEEYSLPSVGLNTQIPRPIYKVYLFSSFPILNLVFTKISSALTTAFSVLVNGLIKILLFEEVFF